MITANNEDDGYTPKPRAVGVGSGELLGRLEFAPQQCANYIELCAAGSFAEVRRIVTQWSGKRAARDIRACCCWDHDAAGPRHGFIVIARQRLKRSLLVHEVTHAGLLFVAQQVMQSERVMAMTPEQQGDYYDEACARVVESLYEQAETLLWPNSDYPERISGE